MTITNQMNARRIVFALLRTYFAMIKKQLSMTSSAEFSKQLEADLAATDAHDKHRSGRPFAPITGAKIGSQLYL